eukprot:TRINITY_DN20438_c0_g1_i1.p1 TRINITY_DN20438_c0_g1~~TRINITY_DN20438_c0_g1_i1.p1  ORF type:complete len:119 (+),score=12.08 TRINITY_DN20438_c0_g1_i1:176-532(+)
MRLIRDWHYRTSSGFPPDNLCGTADRFLKDTGNIYSYKNPRYFQPESIGLVNHADGRKFRDFSLHLNLFTQVLREYLHFFGTQKVEATLLMDDYLLWSGNAAVDYQKGDSTLLAGECD